MKSLLERPEHQSVWMVICIKDDENVTHLFSTKQRAKEFMERDDRVHVLCERLLDAPDHHERRLS